MKAAGTVHVLGTGVLRLGTPVGEAGRQRLRIALHAPGSDLVRLVLVRVPLRTYGVLAAVPAAPAIPRQRTGATAPRITGELGGGVLHGNPPAPQVPGPVDQIGLEVSGACGLDAAAVTAALGSVVRLEFHALDPVTAARQ
ncbi:hypothetical protein [Glycomyces sp. MUSA5-2]|uniref:hypothetical protein n=1 Tax=Glycomyces sp. MUSA5-2 TaxID=2053002 RepID=UPI0030092995